MISEHQAAAGVDSAFDLSQWAEKIHPHPGGFWTAGAQAVVSYPEHGNAATHTFEDDSFWFRHRSRIIVEAVRQFHPGGPIFDIGGGNGFVARSLEDSGFSTVVVEPGLAGARNAVGRGLRHVIQGTVESAGFRPRSLAAVGLFDVLEHTKKDVEFLAALHGLMPTGARIYLTVPAHRWLWSYEDAAAGHHRRYSEKTLRLALRQAGFEIEYLTHFFGFLPLPILVFRAIPSFLGLRRSTSVAIARGEHTMSAWAAGFVQRLSERECAKIRDQRPIRFGSSCLVVARARGAS